MKLTSSDVGGDVYVSAETEERQRRSAQARCSDGGPKERRLKLKRQLKRMRLLKWVRNTPVNEITQQLRLKEATNTRRSTKPSLNGKKKATFP